MKKFDFKSLTKGQKLTRKRILEISFKHNLSHIGSCIGVIDIIDAVYKIKKPKDKFVLSNGHAGIALYVVLEKYGKLNKKVMDKLHIHPDRNPKYDIHVSSGSLGLGFPIALGMALADKKRNIFCTISDGECAEGSVWETARILSELNVTNLKIIVNANGWGAYGRIKLNKIIKRFKANDLKVIEVDGHDFKKLEKILKIKSKKPLVIFARTESGQFPFLNDLHAHYYSMKEEDYKKGIELLS